MAWWPCGDKAAPTTPPIQGYSGDWMDPNAWVILYSPGMPNRPAPIAPRGWGFDFPVRPPGGSMNMIVLGLGKQISGTLSMDVEIQTTDDVEFAAADPAPEGQGAPCSVGFYLQRRNATMGADTPHHRWWGKPRLTLAQGRNLVAVKLAPTDDWSSVFGASATSVPHEFNAALAECDRLGLTFGGGFNFGHGVYLKRGAARFIARDFSTQ